MAIIGGIRWPLVFGLSLDNDIARLELCALRISGIYIEKNIFNAKRIGYI